MKAFIDDIDDDPGDCKGANPPRDTAHPAFIRKTPLQRYKDAFIEWLKGQV